MLDRSRGGISLYGRGRDIEEAETAIEFDRDACRWRVLGPASEVRRSSERAKIISVLMAATEPLKPGALAVEVGMPRSNVDQLVRKMVRDGEIERVGRGNLQGVVSDPTSMFQ